MCVTKAQRRGGEVWMAAVGKAPWPGLGAGCQGGSAGLLCEGCVRTVRIYLGTKLETGLEPRRSRRSCRSPREQLPLGSGRGLFSNLFFWKHSFVQQNSPSAILVLSKFYICLTLNFVRFLTKVVLAVVGLPGSCFCEHMPRFALQGFRALKLTYPARF